MTALAPHMRGPVAEFLMHALPHESAGGRVGWNDVAMTAWQFGCMALAALGYAKLEKWGATRLAEPVPPKIMPRWDDIAWVVLSVLAQRRELEYRLPDGSRYVPPTRPGQFTIKVLSPQPTEPSHPNIQAAHNCGPARAHEDALPLFETLDLTRAGAWSARAELLLWREQPRAWGLDIREDGRFRNGLDRCLETMPEEVLEEMHDLADIDADAVDQAVARQEQANADLVAKYPGRAKFDRTVTREGMFKSLIFRAKSEMDWRFFERWRLTDGWLRGVERARALRLFHDPLAVGMREQAFAAMGLAFPEQVPA